MEKTSHGTINNDATENSSGTILFQLLLKNIKTNKKLSVKNISRLMSNSIAKPLKVSFIIYNFQQSKIGGS